MESTDWGRVSMRVPLLARCRQHTTPHSRPQRSIRQRSHLLASGSRLGSLPFPQALQVLSQ